MDSNNPVMESIKTQMVEFYEELDRHSDGEEWEDRWGFRFRRVGEKVELFVGGQFCEYPWWIV